MVELKNVDVHYADGEKDGIDALNDINIKINHGEFVFIVGKNGAGKSTLLKLLTREIQPTRGRVFVNGYNLGKLKNRKLPYFRRSVGMVFQDFRLIPSMTVYENVAFVLRAIDKPKKDIRSAVNKALTLVQLSDKAKSYPSQLSGGEQQRVAIARAFACDPKIIIADEPTGNLDPEMSYNIVELLMKINSEAGTTILMVTHAHDIVQYFGGRTINIVDGSVKFDDYVDGERDNDGDYLDDED